MTAPTNPSTSEGSAGPSLMRRRLAVIGTGRMGSAMAGRLNAAGADLTLWNRTTKRAQQLANSLGARVATTARDAVADAEVILVSLADDDAVRGAYHGKSGMVSGLHDDAIVLDTSTVSPQTVVALGPAVAKRGGTLLDTPVSGSVSLAEQGALTFMVGGPQGVLDRAARVLDVLGAKTYYVGGLGAGATMKLVVNSVLLGLNQALAEGLVLAERAGVARDTAYDVLAAGAVGAPFVHYKRAAFLHPDDTPVAFSLTLVAKDLRLAEALAGQVHARVDQLGLNRRLAEEAVARGLGDRDLSAIADLLRTS